MTKPKTDIQKYLGDTLNSIRENPWLSTLIVAPTAYYGAGKGYDALLKLTSRFAMPGTVNTNALKGSHRGKKIFKLGAAYLAALGVNPNIPGGTAIRELLKPSVGYSSPLDKTAAANNLFETESVPIGTAMNTIHNDPFMDNQQKSAVNNIIYGAEDKFYGLTSPKKIANSAIDAGIHAGTAIIFGDTIGKIFGLSPSLTRRLSNIGGIASAINSTGIFN